MVVFDPILLQRLKDACDPKVHNVYHGSCIYIAPMGWDKGPYFIKGRDGEWCKHIGLDILGRV
jgi:hypothetical protein